MSKSKSIRDAGHTPHAPRRPVLELEREAIADSAFVAKYLSRVQQGAACWLWTGSTRSKPSGNVVHGLISYRDHTIYAHRMAYLLRHGSIPPGALVCHTCDNGLCQNPDHLYAGSHTTNMADMAARGRAHRIPPRYGMANNKARLTDEQVASLRKLHRGGLSQRALARMFFCSQSTVGRLVHGVTRPRSEDGPSEHRCGH